MFVAERLSLLDALATVDRLAGSPPSALLVAAEDGGLLVAAGTPERGARCSTLAARVLLPGECVVPLGPVLRLLGRVGAQKVEVAANAKAVALALDADGSCGRKFTFPVAPGAEPITDRPEPDAEAVTVELTSASFAALVGRTGFATCRRTEGHGWASDALRFRATGGRLTASATDAFRFATCTAPAATPPRCDRTFLVRERVVRDWLRKLRGTESLKLALGAQLVVRAGSFAAWSARHAGPFPPEDQVPGDRPHAVAVPNAALRSAVETALTILPADDPPVTLALRNNSLTVSSASGATRAESSVPCPGGEGPPLSAVVDGVRLLGALKAYSDQPTVTLEYGADGEPVALAIPDARTVFAPHRQRDPEPQKRGRSAT